MPLSFTSLVIICVLTHIIRSVYEILKYKNIVKAGKLSFVIMFINMVLLWLTWFLICRNDIHKLNLPVIIQYLGLLISITGMVFFLSALFTIKTLESYEGNLITYGIYSKIRHPMYLGFILWLIGFPVFFDAAFSMILGFVLISNILFWRFLEENELRERFPGYSEYRKSTIF